MKKTVFNSILFIAKASMLCLAIAISFSGSLETILAADHEHSIFFDLEKESNQDEKESENKKEKELDKEEKKILLLSSGLYSSKALNLELSRLEFTLIEFHDKIPSPPPEL